MALLRLRRDALPVGSIPHAPDHYWFSADPVKVLVLSFDGRYGGIAAVTIVRPLALDDAQIIEHLWVGLIHCQKIVTGAGRL